MGIISTSPFTSDAAVQSPPHTNAPPNLPLPSARRNT